MSAVRQGGRHRSQRIWMAVRTVGVVLGFALAARQVAWVLGAGWDGRWAEEGYVIAQPIGYLLRAVPGAFLGSLGALVLLVVRDDGSRWAYAFWIAGVVLIALGFVVATAWVGWTPPPDPYR